MSVNRKNDLDPSLVRSLCAGIAARENILLKPRSGGGGGTNKIATILQLKSDNGRPTSGGVIPLEDILLNDMSLKERNKLMKRIPPILKELRTNDMATARSFLGLERYSEVRKKIVNELNEFATADLKMEVMTS